MKINHETIAFKRSLNGLVNGLLSTAIHDLIQEHQPEFQLRSMQSEEAGGGQQERDPKEPW